MWVVCVYLIENDSGDAQDRLFGPFRSQEKAQQFSNKVNAKIDKLTKEQSASFSYLGATVRKCNEPKVKDAIDFIHDLMAL